MKVSDGDEMRWNSGNFPEFRETFSSVLIFHLIPLFSAWCTRKKELIQKKKKHTTTNTNSSSMSHDYRVSRRRQGSGCRCRITRRDLRNVLTRQACAWRLKSSPLLKTTAFDFCVPHHAYASVFKTNNNTLGETFCCGAAIGLLLQNYTASYPGTFIAKKISNHIVWDTEPSTAPRLWGINKNR